MTYKKVDGDPNFARDMSTGMIININNSEVERQKRFLEQRRKERQEFEQLKSDMSEIKALLGQLIEKNKNG